MAIVGFENVEVLKDELDLSFRTSTIINKDTPVKDVKQFLGGSKMKVNYFHRLTAEDDILTTLDTASPDSLFSYDLIRDLTFNVVDPMDQTLETLTGSALLTTLIIPQPGDYFETYILGNRRALFVITEAKQFTYNLNKGYEVLYTLDSFVDVDEERYLDLLTKTVRTSYVKENDSYLTNTTSLLSSADKNFEEILDSENKLMTKLYFQTCLDKESNVLLNPSNSTFDNNVEDFVFSTMENLTSLNMNNVTKIGNVTDVTILSSLKNLNLPQMKHSKQLTFINDVNVNSPYLRGLYVMGVKKYIDFEIGKISIGSITTPGLPVKTDNTYIVSKEFYIENSKISTIEILLMEVFNHKPITDSFLKTLLQTWRDWNKEEVFYYLPILKAIIKYRLYKNGRSI